MSEDKGKDEISAQNLMKKHTSYENEIIVYETLARSQRHIQNSCLQPTIPLSHEITLRQAQLEKLYGSLKDLALEKRTKLDEGLQLFGLNREVDALMQWIADKEIVAGSQELGQDYEHVTMLQARFKDFAKETESIGRERVSKMNFHSDRLINAHHGDSATIAEWKDMLNEAWADLLELIETRTQMLKASWKLHRFFYDCADVLGRII
ncbi:Spectrin beta chain, partial [Araneus ventricosus]